MQTLCLVYTTDQQLLVHCIHRTYRSFLRCCMTCSANIYVTIMALHCDRLLHLLIGCYWNQYQMLFYRQMQYKSWMNFGRFLTWNLLSVINSNLLEIKTNSLRSGEAACPYNWFFILIPIIVLLFLFSLLKSSRHSQNICYYNSICFVFIFVLDW